MSQHWHAPPVLAIHAALAAALSVEDIHGAFAFSIDILVSVQVRKCLAMSNTHFLKHFLVSLYSVK